MKIVYFQDSHILKKGEMFYNAKDSHFFDRFTANLLPGEKLDIFMRQKELPNDYDVAKLMNVSTNLIAFHKMPSFWNPLKIFRIRKIIKNAIKNSDFAYIRTEGIFGCLAGLFCLKYKKPYMSIMPADPKVGLRKHGIIGYIVSLFHIPRVKKVVNKADYAYYVTESYLQARYPSNGIVFGCSDVQLTDISDDVLEKRLNKTETNKLIIGSAGALLPSIKGQDLVIKAMAKIKKTDLEYQIIGMGTRDEIEEFAKKYGVEKKVQIFGTLPHDKVFNWLDGIDIYIQPSRTEGLPRALIEAMSRGLPCIGSNVGGIPELLSPECIFTPNEKGLPKLASLIDFFSDNNNRKKYSIENFEKSKKYDKTLINAKQKTFFKEFDQYARSKS